MTEATAQIEWVTAVKRQHSPLFLSILVAGQDENRIKRMTGLSIRLTNIRRHLDALQYDKREISNARGHIRSIWIDAGTEFFRQFAERCITSCATVLDGLHSEDVHADDSQSVEHALDRYIGLVSDHASFLQTMILVQFELEGYLDVFTATRLGTSDRLDHTWIHPALKIALQPTHEVSNGIALLELGRYVQENVADSSSWTSTDPIDLAASIANERADIWDQINQYVSKFGWMGKMYYIGDRLTTAGTVMRLQNILRFDCAVKLTQNREKREAELQRREDAIRALGDDDTARTFADVVSTYMYLRSYRLDVFFIADDIMTPAYAAAAPFLGLRSAADLPFLTGSEILSAIGNKASCSSLRTIVEERRKAFTFIAHAGECRWIAGDSGASGADADAVEPSAGRTSELHGTTAWPGRVRGRVRVVSGERDMELMQPGEILVTTMTMPSLMLAVEKAGAIVTDEGGMLCHAAIVSREFDIPCLIGTGVATDNFATGDLVEVDATAGVIRSVI